jgi:hypothetical protein
MVGLPHSAVCRGPSGLHAGRPGGSAAFVRAEHRHAHAASLLREDVGGLEAGHVRHGHVHQDDVRTELRGDLDSLATVAPSPTTDISPFASNRPTTALRTRGWSSTTRTRRGAAVTEAPVACVGAPCAESCVEQKRAAGWVGADGTALAPFVATCPRTTDQERSAQEACRAHLCSRARSSGIATPRTVRRPAGGLLRLAPELLWRRPGAGRPRDLAVRSPVHRRLHGAGDGGPVDA